jgi:hypothetical protein
MSQQDFALLKNLRQITDQQAYKQYRSHALYERMSLAASSGKVHATDLPFGDNLRLD